MMPITTDALELMVEQNRLSSELTGVLRSLIDEVKGIARPSNEPALLNDVDAAAYIGMSAMFLRRARSEGQVGNRTPAPKYVEIGGSVRYERSELDRWIREDLPHKRSIRETVPSKSQ